MARLLLATTNPGKIEEFKLLLKPYIDDVVSAADLKIAEAPDESGETYAENSLIKANYYWQKGNLPTLADDGGLEIDALNGEPGVHSRRMNGQIRTDDELRDLFLGAVKGKPETEAGALLRVVLTLRVNRELDFQSEAVLEGVIKDSDLPRVPGYPVRSIFWIPSMNKFYSQFTPEEEMTVSHRAKALKKLIPLINQYV